MRPFTDPLQRVLGDFGNTSTDKIIMENDLVIYIGIYLGILLGIYLNNARSLHITISLPKVYHRSLVYVLIEDHKLLSNKFISNKLNDGNI
jgi:hypothetical protein